MSYQKLAHNPQVDLDQQCHNTNTVLCHCIIPFQNSSTKMQNTIAFYIMFSYRSMYCWCNTYIFFLIKVCIFIYMRARIQKCLLDAQKCFCAFGAFPLPSPPSPSLLCMWQFLPLFQECFFKQAELWEEKFLEPCCT